ncbi:uncharacterized protein LOC112904299 [Agrilus planipennis]|uniref:Uncharacterized protein LOC112904299 n=1 Tax=Agrilus planipennis TaxID=224129 RepID=A0A7F5R2T1_AGRPL|nr:uncharacterized protein LOC112904299 [Agrilus planipennis]
MLLNHFSWMLLLLISSKYKTEATELDADGSRGHSYKISPYLRREITTNYEESFPDDDLMALSSGGGSKFNKKKNKSSVGSSNDSEEKKTLAQQVAEGKYALIQNELFLKPPKRPGILSYEANSEIPNDTVHTLGGLAKKEIWLADSHLLVLTGGTFQPYETTDGGGNAWRPIDFYKAPKRPVKLPTRPKVPPPFPVQLIEGGPLQILGTNSTRTLDESEKTSTPVPPPEGYIPGSGPYFPPTNQDPTNSITGQTAFGNPSVVTETVPTPVFSLNSSNLPPHFASLPPGAVVLPPPNLTVMIDEEDPSIYYPPPYSFYYEVDNSTKVPPGPLVPGLILPPPPDFFAPLEGGTPTERSKTVTTKTSISSKTSVRFRMKTSKTTTSTTTTPPTTKTTYASSTTPSFQKYKTKQSRVSFVEKTTLPNHFNRPIFRARNRTIQRPVSIQPQHVHVRPENRVTEKPSIVSSRLIEEIHIKTIPDVTTPTYQHLEDVQLNKIKDTTTPNSLLAYRNSIVSNKINFDEPSTRSTTKRIPVKIYITPAYADAGLKRGTPVQRTKRPKNIYYFEESPDDQYRQSVPKSEVPFSTPSPDIVKETPRHRYHAPPPPTPLLRQIKLSPAPSDDDSFKQHIDQIRNQIRKFQTSQDSFVSNNANPRHKSQPLYQYSFEAHNYPEQHRINEEHFRNTKVPDAVNDNRKYTVNIQPAIEVTSQGPVIRQSSPFLVPPQDAYRSTQRPTVDQYYDNQQEQEKYRPNGARKDLSHLSGVPYPYYDIFVYDINGRRELYETPEENLSWQPRPRKPVSLHDDINVNYNTRGLQINPDAEIIQIPQQTQHYPQQTSADIRERSTRPNSYYDTPATYYQGNRRQQSTSPRGTNPPATAFISYKLPGDEEAHFYFLTPQQTKQQQQQRHHDFPYYYKNDNDDNGRLK